MERGYENFRKAIAAGVFIGMGCIAYLSCENKVVGAFLFGIGLCAVCVFGSKLFTGVLCVSEDPKELLLVCIGNVIGILIMCVIAKHSGIISGVDMSERISRPFYQNILRGIICEICIYIAVMSMKMSDKNLLLVILGVMCFILCGGEHCIADDFYLMVCEGGDLIKEAIFISSVTAGNAIGAAIMRLLDPYGDCYFTFSF